MIKTGQYVINGYNHVIIERRYRLCIRVVEMHNKTYLFYRHEKSWEKIGIHKIIVSRIQTRSQQPQWSSVS